MKRLFCVLTGLSVLSTLCVAQQPPPQPPPSVPPPSPQPQQLPQQPERPPLPKYELVTLTGTIAAVAQVAEYEPVTFTLRDAAGVNTVISTVPKVILDKFGLKLEEKADVAVTVSRKVVAPGNTETNPEKLIARSVKVNGKEVAFYDPKTGTQTFSIYEAYSTLNEYKGEITKVDRADVVLPGGDATKTQKKVTLYVTVSRDDITNPNVAFKDSFITVPETYLQQIQFTPEVGMKVTLSGWIYKQQAAQLENAQTPMRLRPTIKAITVNDKTYPFRDDNGKGLWETTKPSPATPTKAP